MEKGKGKETSQSESNTKDDLKSNDTKTLALRSFFQQLVSRDSVSPPKTNEEGAPLNTDAAQVVQKLAHKEPALLYFYHKLFPNADHVTQKVVIDMVEKVVQDAKESAKSPRMKPRSYVPPKVARSRTLDHFDNSSTGIESEEEEEARKLVLLSNLQAILREAIRLNELQVESHLNVQRIGIGRRVDVPYTPVLTSKGKSIRKVNEQKSQGTPGLNTTVKIEEGNFLPPPPPLVIDLKSEGSLQKDSQLEASTSKGKVAETKNVQQNQAILTNNSNPVIDKVEEGKFSLSETIINFQIKENDDQTTVKSTQREGSSPKVPETPYFNFSSTAPSKYKGESAEKVTEQKDRAAPKSGPGVTDKIEEGKFLPPVVNLKPDESEKKDSTFTKASTSKGKVAETKLNEQSKRTTPTISSKHINEKDKAALSEFVINFISKEESQQYFRYNPTTSTSNGKSAEKSNEQTGAASSINITEKEKAVPGVADFNQTDTFAQASTSNTGKIAEKVDVQGAAAADLKSKESDQKHARSTQASTSSGKVNVEKQAAPPPPPPPVAADPKFKENNQKQSESTQASTSNGKSTPDHINVKVEKERDAAAPPPPPPVSVDVKSKESEQRATPASPPPVRRKPKVEDISHQEEIYVTSAHARERVDKSRLRQGNFGGRVVPKPEPINSNPTQGSVKSNPTEKGQESEERKPEPTSSNRAGSSKAETTAKPESKSAESNSSKYNTSSSSSKVSSGIQTEPVKEYRSTGTSSTSGSQVPRGETRSEYPAASSPPPPKAKYYEGKYGESKSTNGYGYERPSPALGASFAAQCSGITNEGRRCLIVVRTIFDGENFKPLCQWHGAYYGSAKPKSLDPNKKEIGRCSATTQMGTLWSAIPLKNRNHNMEEAYDLIVKSTEIDVNRAG
ncbi:hypothetical protein Clacol_009438 [Clathrus columnatus]|uniref:Uncharacterized protein n=1 Tax=Clathrus columnatus TaxID=1419009 RepID=A0AAV5AR45_9AGAM|nr:hypothetical protein Clacol_009438 [Clathrus columnatus]